MDKMHPKLNYALGKRDCLTTLGGLRLCIVWTIAPASSLLGGSGILVFELISQIKFSIFLIHLNFLHS